MQFGEGLSMEDGYAQLSHAYERGVNFFDSAEMYPVPQNEKSHGKSEECLVSQQARIFRSSNRSSNLRLTRYLPSFQIWTDWIYNVSVSIEYIQSKHRRP